MVLDAHMATIQDSTSADTSLQVFLGDLYEPPSVPFTFDTIGWKVLGCLILVSLVIFMFYQIRRYVRNQYRREALQVLSQIESGSDMSRIFIILKQVAIQVFGRSEVAHLQGKDWLAFLDKTGKNVEFQPLGGHIAKILYENIEVDKDTQQQLLTQSQRWIKTHAREL